MIFLISQDSNQTPLIQVSGTRLLNVAVSRAKEKLRVVVSTDIAAGGGNVADLVRYIRYRLIITPTWYIFFLVRLYAGSIIMGLLAAMKMSSKGHIVIPEDVRNAIVLKSVDKFVVIENKENHILRKR